MKKRQKKKHIPFGSYCYTSIGILKDGMGIKIKCCPYYQFLGKKLCEGEYKGEKYSELVPQYKCTYENVTSEDVFLLDDQVKICGVHNEYNKKKINRIRRRYGKKGD